MLRYKVPLLITTLTILMFVCGFLTESGQRADLFVSSMRYFNFPFSLAILLMTWGYSVQLFDAYLVPYEVILDLEPPLTPGPVIVKSGWDMLLAVWSFLALYWVFFAALPIVAPIMPILLYVGGMIYCSWYFWPSRQFLWSRVKGIASVPVFADSFFADVITNLSKDLADISTAVCSMIYVWGWISTEVDSRSSRCGPHSWVAVGVSAAPFVLRLFQCVRLYFSFDPQAPNPLAVAASDPTPRLWLNVVKQMLQLAVIFLARTYYFAPDSFWSDYYRPAWIAVMIALTIFSVYSDLFVDWNLRISDWFLGVPTVTTQIFVHRMWWYYGFIVLSIFLRVSWAWRLSDLDSSWLPFLLSLVEIFRRAISVPLIIEGQQHLQGIGPRGGNELAAVGAGAPAEPVVNIED